MSNKEIIEKLRILEGAILNPHHRTGEYVDKRFADVVIAAADALEAADKLIAESMPKEGVWIGIDGTMFSECSVCGERHYGCDTPFCDMCGAKMLNR